jgi:hypothetical protein
MRQICFRLYPLKHLWINDGRIPARVQTQKMAGKALCGTLLTRLLGLNCTVIQSPVAPHERLVNRHLLPTKRPARSRGRVHDSTL